MSTNKSDHRDSQRSLVKSMSIISLGTLSSRILGFVRDIIIAKFLGTGMKADAFFVAFRIPNLLRELVGEGASNAAVVPVFSEYVHKEDKEELSRLMSIVLTLAAVSLTVMTLLGIFLTPWIVKIMAPGFLADPEKYSLTVFLTQLMFPYLVLIGLTAYSMGILYSLRSFTAPAFAPCLLNVALIASVFVVVLMKGEVVYGLSVGVLAGGVLQLMMQTRALAKKGMKFVFPKTFNHPGLIKIGQLLFPRMLGAGVYELNIFVDTFCASLASVVGVGGISAIYYANRLVQFPMGIVGVAFASAALPTFSSLVVTKDLQKLKETVLFAVENILFVMFPCSILLMILSAPVVKLLFQRGEFTAYSTGITSTALLFYSVGLFGFGATKILVSVFYAFQDTKTPVKVGAVCLLINASLNFILMYPLKVGGIALASSIAGITNFIILFYLLDRKLEGMRGELDKFMLKIFGASLVMGLTVLMLWVKLPILPLALRIAVAGAGGTVVYLMTCYLFKIPQVLRPLNLLQEKLKR